jgi:DNA (cytosine-5)-methyltransferase 1
VSTWPLPPQQVISRIDELLELKYRSADLGNLGDPLAETVFILLSKQTRDSVYRRVFTALRRSYPTWLDVLHAPDKDLEDLLAPGGFQRQRASQLKALLSAVEVADQERGVGPTAHPACDLTLDFLRGQSDVEAERFLLALPGIGKKSARCVLAYALDRPVFAVDTNVHRVFFRLGLFPSSGRKADHDPFQDAVPIKLRKRLHVNLVHHGRAVCRPRVPRCGECPLVSFCVAGREAVSKPPEAPIAVDLFAGAGGLGHGFRAAGFRVALAVESDRHAAQTYRLNNPGVPVVEWRITDKTTAGALRRQMPGVGAIDVVLAGPPCQGYSAAGSRDPDDERNGLYTHVSRLARQMRAEFVVLEQVPGVRRVNGHGFLNTIRDSLQLAGYHVDSQLVHACEFGVPQHRARYLFLGRRRSRGTRSAPPGLKPTHTAHAEAGSVLERRTPTPRLIDLLNRIPTLDAGVRAEYHLGPDGRVLFNMTTMAHSEKVIAKIAGIRPGEGPISYRRLEATEARTLIAGHRAMPVHPSLNRSISVREAAVIQGFPLAYVFCGPPAEQPLQVANAVPPPLARALGVHLIGLLQESGRASPSRGGRVR